MNHLFIQLLRVSLIADIIIVLVVLIRYGWKKLPKWIVCLLWGVVALRLLFPVSIESSISLVPNALAVESPIRLGSDRSEIVIPETNDERETASSYQSAGAVSSSDEEATIEDFREEDSPVVEQIVPGSQEGISVQYDKQVETSQRNRLIAKEPVSLVDVLAWIWLIGVIGILAYAVVSYIFLYQRVRTSTKLERNIRQSENIQTPFVFGIFKPTVYLPYLIAEEDCPYVLLHEQAHIKRWDPVWKLLGFGILAIYWFNPLCWVAYSLFCKDLESACDETVIANMGREERKAYSLALLHSSIGSQGRMTYPLAFGEIHVKERIKQIMNFQTPKVSICILAIAVAALLCGCFLTNPNVDEVEESAQETSEVGGANPWRETTIEEISSIFGETIQIPEGAEDPELRIIESSRVNEAGEEVLEHLAELTFYRDGYFWTARVKQTSDYEDISGMYFDWTVVEEMFHFSVSYDGIDSSGSGSVEREYRQYDDQGHYYGLGLYFSEGTQLQYTLSYQGGSYRDMYIMGEVWPELWWYECPMGATSGDSWEDTISLYNQYDVQWSPGQRPVSIQTEEEIEYQWEKAGLVLETLELQGNNVSFSPAMLDLSLGSLTEAMDPMMETTETFWGRTMEEQRIWSRFFRLSLPQDIALRGISRGWFSFDYSSWSPYGWISTDCYNVEPLSLFSVSDEEDINYSMLHHEKYSGVSRWIDHRDVAEGELVNDMILHLHPVWDQSYAEVNVTETSFRNENGSKTSVQGMYSEENRYLENTQATGFIKTFDNGRYGFVTILPKESFSISSFSLVEFLNSETEDDFLAMIPAFTVDQTLDFVPVLPEIGMAELLEEGVLTQVAEGEPQTLSALYNRLIMEVNPSYKEPVQNTEQLDKDTMSKEVLLDRPFYYVVLDMEYGYLLSVGSIRNMI